MKQGIVIAQGFEKQFLSAWGDWDDIGMMAIQFYDIQPNLDTEEGRSIPSDVDTVAFFMDEGKMNGYNEEGDVVFSHKIKIVLDK